MHTTASVREQGGVTLAELAIALALFAVIMLGLLAMWHKAQEAYFLGAEAAETQQNLRTALDLMVREIRSTGRDVSLCAFDFAGAAGLDCTGAKVSACRTRLGGGYPSTGCQRVFAIPFESATATTLRIRADRNDSGTVAGTSSAGATDLAEEDVLYALASGSPPCPPGVSACITRDDGNGPMAMVAVDIAALRFTYFPRPGYPPCDGIPTPRPCPAFTSIGSQQDADNIGRIRVTLTAVTTMSGQPMRRTLETDLVLKNRT